MNHKLTTKLLEGLQRAQKQAQSGGRAQIYPAELLLALTEQEGGVLRSVLKRTGAEPTTLETTLTNELQKLPEAW